MREISVAQAAGQLEVLLEAALEGEKVVITEEAGAVELVPVKPRRKRVFGSARGVFEIPEDFDDETLPDLDEYRARGCSSTRTRCSGSSRETRSWAAWQERSSRTTGTRPS